MKSILKHKLETIKGLFYHAKQYLNARKKSNLTQDDSNDYIEYVTRKNELNSLFNKLSENSPESKRDKFCLEVLMSDNGLDVLTSLSNDLSIQSKSFKGNSGYIDNNELIQATHDVSVRINNAFGGSGSTGSFGGLFNSQVGQGTSLDFSTYDFRSSPQFLLDRTFTVFFQTSSIAKQLIDILTRWYACDFVEVSIKEKSEDEEKKIKEVQNLIKKKKIRKYFISAVKQMFMHGGCALYINTSDQNESLPLKMYKGKDFNLRLIDKSLMFPAAFMDLLNAESEGFNHPSHWQIIFSGNKGTLPIHHSRFIFFIPDELPFEARIQQLWWGMSALVPVRDYINIVDRGFHSVGNQLQQSSIAIFKNQYEDKANRTGGILTTANNQKVANTKQAFVQNGNFVAVGSKDDIKRMEVGNLVDQVTAAEKIVGYVSCAWGIPPSEFYSSSSGGYHSSDPVFLSWMNTVEKGRFNYTSQPLDQIFYLLSMNLYGEEDIAYYKFPELNKPSILQKADIRLKNMQTAAIAKKIGFPNDVIAKQAVRDNDFEDMSMDNVENVINDMNKFDKEMQMSLNMEGKDIKDDKSSRKKPTDSVTSATPESIVSGALK